MKKNILIAIPVLLILILAVIYFISDTSNPDSNETSHSESPNDAQESETVADQAEANSTVNASTDISESEANTIITVGMSGGYKPYTYVDEDGELTGFDVDVWLEIGNRTGYDVEFVTSDFSGLFGMLDAGQLTTIANQITVTESRLEKYLFSSPYVYYGAHLAVHENTTDIQDLESLKGKKVGVDLGTNYEETLRAFDTENEIEIITYGSGSGALQDVAIGRIDAYLQDKLALLTTINEAGLDVKLAGEPVEILFNAFPFVNSPENEALLIEINEAIESIREDGTFEAISLKYFPINITEE